MVSFRMNHLRRHWFWPTLLMVLFVPQFLVRHEQVDRVAPPIRGITLEGRPFDSTAFSGKPALIYFWGSWCPVCGAMQASIRSVAADHPIVTVATQSGGRDAVLRYQTEHDFHPPTVLDEDGALAKSFGIRGVPVAFILGADGVIRHVAPGYTTEFGLRVRLWLAGL